MRRHVARLLIAKRTVDTSNTGIESECPAKAGLAVLNLGDNLQLKISPFSCASAHDDFFVVVRVQMFPSSTATL